MNPESADGSLPGRLLILGLHRQRREIGNRHRAHSFRDLPDALIFAAGMEREALLSPSCAKEDIVGQKPQNHRIKSLGFGLCRHTALSSDSAPTTHLPWVWHLADF